MVISPNYVMLSKESENIFKGKGHRSIALKCTSFQQYFNLLSKIVVDFINHCCIAE